MSNVMDLNLTYAEGRPISLPEFMDILKYYDDVHGEVAISASWLHMAVKVIEAQAARIAELEAKYMESELAKTLRAMSDDHRMVPDFSEQLLDIADTIERLQKELGLARKQRSEFAQSGLRLEAERDAALAEIERLKVQRDKAMAIGGVNFCAACGDEPVLEELQDSDIPGLGRTFCQKCRVAIGQSDLAS